MSPSPGAARHPLPKRERNRGASSESSIQSKDAKEEAPSSSPTWGEGGERSETGEGDKTNSLNDNLLDIARRVEQLTVFLDTDDGKNLVAGTKRAANFLNAEEKKGEVSAEINESLLNLPEEIALNAAIVATEPRVAVALSQGDYTLAMRELAGLKDAIYGMLDGEVQVNDPDPAIRANRLALLKRVAMATGMIADFSKISG
jgi:glycyl-tRNA synthetase beta chain